MLRATKRFWGKRPGFDVGDLLHIGVNAGFALVIYATVFYWKLTPLAVALVILSKWRVLAVKPRFWLPNIRANLVDLIVGLSTVGLLYHTSNSLVAVGWTVLYGAWLLALKPRDHELWVGVQSLWAQLLGLSVIFMTVQFINTPVVFCATAGLIAWAVARHLFSNYEEPHYRLLSLAWAFFVVQIVWISLHWLQYYRLFGLKIAVTAVVITIVASCLGSIYHAVKMDKLTKGLLMENLMFGGVLLVIILATAQWVSQF